MLRASSPSSRLGLLAHPEVDGGCGSRAPRRTPSTSHRRMLAVSIMRSRLRRDAGPSTRRRFHELRASADDRVTDSVIAGSSRRRANAQDLRRPASARHASPYRSRAHPQVTRLELAVRGMIVCSTARSPTRRDGAARDRTRAARRLVERIVTAATRLGLQLVTTEGAGEGMSLTLSEESKHAHAHLEAQALLERERRPTAPACPRHSVRPRQRKRQLASRSGVHRDT